MNDQQIAVYDEPQTAPEVLHQVTLIQEVMRAVMKDGTHYGTIPGTPKPSLYKAGAEKLSLTFRLRPVIDNDRDVRVDLLENGHREITVYCHIMSASGTELATGVGSCSTLESKYRYRGGDKIPTGQAVPTEYWNLKKAGKLQDAKTLIGGDKFGVAKIDGTWQVCEIGEKMENPDIADQYNTVLKMAKKRAYLDGILSATAASDIFTQDMEDAVPDKADKGGPVPQPQSTQPAREAADPKPEQPATEANAISEPQAKRLFAIAMTAKWSKDELRQYLKDYYGIDRSIDIRKTDYEAICDYIQKMPHVSNG